MGQPRPSSTNSSLSPRNLRHSALTAEDAEDAEKSVRENEIGETILGCAIKVHSALGPGLLESTYEVCLIHEILKAGVKADRQIPLPVIYDGVELEAGYRMDLLVAGIVVVELKVVEKLLPLHTAQLLSYLKLSKRKLGYLLNFNVVQMRDGIKRVVNNL
jgi:GxxExxY protein